MFKTLKKAQKGFTIIELLIVIAIIAILALLVLNNIQGGQAKARDSTRTGDINGIHTQLENYYNENSSYPQTFTAETLPGIDEGALTDPTGNNSITMATAVADRAAAEAAGTNPGGDTATTSGYSYIPYNCTASACTGYVLKTFIEKPTDTTPNPYVKRSLND